MNNVYDLAKRIEKLLERPPSTKNTPTQLNHIWSARLKKELELYEKARNNIKRVGAASTRSQQKPIRQLRQALTMHGLAYWKFTLTYGGLDEEGVGTTRTVLLYVPRKQVTRLVREYLVACRRGRKDRWVVHRAHLRASHAMLFARSQNEAGYDVKLAPMP